MEIRNIAFTIVSLVWLAFGASGQNCYYPDGSLSTEGDAACTNQGGACCPLNWECMSNGLCYLANAGYWGRYTCTDQTWQSPDCPQLCTQGNTAAGNEAILWCSQGDWCCDGNRVSFNCCTKADAVHFNLPSPSPIKFISTVPTPTPAKTVTNKPFSSSTAIFSSSSSAANSQPSSVTTIIHKSVTTGLNGSPTTIIRTTEVVTTSPAAVAPASSPKNDNNNRASTNLPLIVGIAIGVPLVLLIAACFLWWFVKHMRDSNKAHRESSYGPGKSQQDSPSQLIEPNYQVIPDGSHAHEKLGSPVAQVDRTSELYGSDATFRSPDLYCSSPISPWSPKMDTGLLAADGMPAGRSELPASMPGENTGLQIHEPAEERRETYMAWKPEYAQQTSADRGEQKSLRTD